MNIIVLGASSQIGSGIASVLAPGNNLLLVGRNISKLQEAAERCQQSGAATVAQFAGDLREDCGEILRAASSWQIDLIVNSASATSRLRDSEIALEKLEDYVRVDLLTPLELIEKIWVAQARRPLRIVLISTILTVVKSPNRTIYSSLKVLQEQCLRGLTRSHNGLHVLIVRIGKVIPPARRTADVEKLARVVKKALEKKKTNVTYGLAGRFMTALFYAQPLASSLVVKIRRMVSNSRGAARAEP